MRRFAPIWIALAGLTASLPVGARVSLDGQSVSVSDLDGTQPIGLDTLAGRALLPELQKKHPEMQRWTVTPLVRPSVEVIASEAVSDLKVLRVGARSAVQIAWAAKDSSRQVRTIWFDVVGIQPMVVAAHDIAPNASLSAVDAAMEERDVMATACTPLRDVSELSQMRSRRALRAGAAICVETIEPRPAVARGDDVTVRYSSERVSLTTKGIAQSDGQVGQKLRVVNPVTKDSFVAVVSAAQEVSVHE